MQEETTIDSCICQNAFLYQNIFFTLEVQDQTKNDPSADPCKGFPTTKGQSFCPTIFSWSDRGRQGFSCIFLLNEELLGTPESSKSQGR